MNVAEPDSSPDATTGPGEPLLFDRPSPAEARALVEGQGLRFEPDFDDLVGLYAHGRLVACGARAGYVLKMLVIARSHQGSDALGTLVTFLVQSARAAGHDTVFVFTPPRNAPSFEALNFRLLVTAGESALLEYGPGLPAYLEAAAPIISPGRNGAVVVNGNPFTRGHLDLVEAAAREVDRLYLFIVREDRSVFPFEVRHRLASVATQHLRNVVVLDTSRYAVSAGTFPSYFMKRLDGLALAQMRLDLLLFAERIAPAFHIVRRFVGREPFCATTAAYNQAMSEILARKGLGWVERPRLEFGGQAISATWVRRALREGGLESIRSLVPVTTYDYLCSPEARPIAEQLRTLKEEV